MNTDISKKKIKDYDAMAKSVLACKDVIANILKYTVREFKDYSVSEIIPYINGEPEIGTEEVDDNILPKIDAAGAEAVSVSDGGRMFDIKFRARIPGGDSEAVLIINIEAQKKYHLSYYIERRGIYYLSRLISSQY